MMQNLYLIAIVGGERTAICASKVESVVKTGEMIPVPKTSRNVAGLFAMRSRVITMIDCQYCATGRVMQDFEGAPAVVICDGAHYFGLLVDKVLEVVDATQCAQHPVPRLSAGWSKIVKTIIELEDGPVMVLETEKLIASKPEQRAA